jgi:6-phosphogluconolactonase
LTARIVVSDTPAALAYQAAGEFKTQALAAIKERGRFAVALSGGSTPRAMLAQLSWPQLAQQIPWGRVHVFWGDERMVPPDDPSSNFGMADAALLTKVPIPKFQIHRMHGELEPDEAAAQYDDELRRFFDGPTAFDLTFLGLGPDGHTASLFPYSNALNVHDKLCVANKVGEANVVSPWRLTLTYPALNASRAVMFLVEGAAKADILAEVLEGPSDPQRLPAQGIAPAETLTWFVDAACAAKLRRRSTI